MAAHTVALAPETAELAGERHAARSLRSTGFVVGWLWSGALFVILTFLVAYP